MSIATALYMDVLQEANARQGELVKAILDHVNHIDAPNDSPPSVVDVDAFSRGTESIMTRHGPIRRADLRYNAYRKSSEPPEIFYGLPHETE